MGLGRRTFAAGEVLTSSNVMNYLMDQSIMNFADSTARGSALGTAVAEGMVSYLNNTDSLEVYRTIGTAAPSWQPVAFESYADAKSGLFPIAPSSVVIATGSGTANALGQVSFTGATSVSLNGVFSSNYNSYRVIVSLSAASTSSALAVRFSSGGTIDVTNSYTYAANAVNAAGTTGVSTASAQTYIPLMNLQSGSSGHAGSFDVMAPAIANKTVMIYQGTGLDGASSLFRTLQGAGNSGTNNIHDGIAIVPLAGNITGNIQVFGYND